MKTLKRNCIVKQTSSFVQTEYIEQCYQIYDNQQQEIRNNDIQGYCSFSISFAETELLFLDWHDI